MSKVKMTIACGEYDRIRALQDGSVAAEGLDLNVVVLPIEEIFFRVARFQDFDAAEMSLSSYLIAKSRGAPRLTAIPVFLSRKFRHQDIYIRSDSGISRPQDLKGGRIGMPEYQMTAPVWMRGIFEEFYGVAATDVHWFSGGTERPGREERLHLTLPSQFRLTPIAADTTLFELLRRGELDAVFTARVPSPFLNGEKWIARLFPNFREVEGKYFQQTGIFPIMHTFVLREDIYTRHPWAAQSLYKAFCRAKERCFENMSNAAALPVMLPWFNAELETTFALMGKDFWPYGLEANEKTLVKFLQYMHEQGLLPPEFNPEPKDLFAPNTLKTFGV